MRAQSRRSLTFISVAIAALAISSSLQAQSFLNSSNATLSAGGRQTLCPHTAARELRRFWTTDDTLSKASARALYSGQLRKRWAFLRMGHASVPTLMEDG